MTATPGFYLPFPHDDDLARAYFSEAIRHLQDARVLHEVGRYAGAITSTMKATELGLKSLMILYGIRGWHDLNTHRMMTVVKFPIFDNLLTALKSHYPTVVSDVEEIERLVPEKQSLSKLTFIDAQNTEYPFFAEEAAINPRRYRLYLPEAYFDKRTSEEYFQTAHRLLSTIQTISPEASAWGLVVCPSL